MMRKRYWNLQITFKKKIMFYFQYHESGKREKEDELNNNIS